MKTLAIATAAIGLVLTATPTLANEGAPRSQNISFAGIDLASEAGQRMLEQRLEIAARSVCSFDEHTVGTRIRSNESRTCLVKARASAKRQVAALIEANQRGG